MENLPNDIIFYILVLLPSSFEGIVSRIQIRRVSKRFKCVRLLSNFDDKLVIHEQYAHFKLKPETQKCLLVFDIDELKWKHIQFKVLKTLSKKPCKSNNCYCHSRTIYLNICTLKYLWAHANNSNLHYPHTFYQSYIPICSGRLPLQKVPFSSEINFDNVHKMKIPRPIDSSTDSRRLLRTTAQKEEGMEILKIDDISISLIQEASYTRNIQKLVLQTTSLSSFALKVIGENLPKTSITDIDLSGNINGGEGAYLSSIFLNGLNLSRLQLNYCCKMSKIDTAELCRLLLHSKLERLCMIHTIFDYDVTLMQACMLCISLQYLFITCGTTNQELFTRRLLETFKLHQSIRQISIGNMRNDILSVYTDDHIKNFSEIWLGTGLYNSNRALQNVQHFIVSSGFQVKIKMQKKQEKTKERNTDKLKALYAKRNEIRNQFLKEARTCKGCNTIWPPGSVKIQAFEGMQSLCARGLKSCNRFQAFKLVGLG